MVMLISAAMASWPHMYSIDSTPIEEVLESAEFVFVGTVTETDTMAWYGPEDQTVQRVHTLRVEEEIKGHIETGWVRLWLERPMGTYGQAIEGGETSGQVLVIGHTKRFYCFNGPCSRSPSLAGVPYYDDLIVLEAQGSAFQEYTWTGETISRVVSFYGSAGASLTELGWEGLKGRIRELVRPSSDPMVIRGWQP